LSTPVATNSKHATPRYFLVLPAAGSGRRMQAGLPKQYLSVAGKPVLQHTLERLGAMPEFIHVVVALAEGDDAWPEIEAALDAGLRGKLLLAAGGAERFQSVANALAVLQAYASPDDWVLVHDAASSSPRCTMNALEACWPCRCARR
jgi:2-C-methyl-D-erythritol 4-phosphate cytidylyltransferase